MNSIRKSDSNQQESPAEILLKLASGATLFHSPDVEPPDPYDEALLSYALRADGGGKFTKLWEEGDWEGAGYPSQSEADLALCNKLAFWTGRDKARMNRLFRQSGLYREEWDRLDYSNATLDKAIEFCKIVYNGSKKAVLHNGECPPSSAQGGDEGSQEHSDAINRLNKEHAVVMIGGKCRILNEVVDPIFNRPDVTFSSFTDFTNRYANDIVLVQNGNGDYRPESIAKVWIESPNRREYEGIVFAPGEDFPGQFNLWRGLAVEPIEGDWSLNRGHIFEIICNGNQAHFLYLMNYMARIVQEPGGERPGVSVVLKGGRGTGKGAFVRAFGGLFGPHFLHVTSPNQVIGKFNQHLKNCILLFADEAFWAGDKTGEGILKGLITEPTIRIEPKGIDSFGVKNHVNLIVASNNDWVIPAAPDERRFFVLEVSDERKQDHEYFKTLQAEMENGGREAMLYDLLQMDLSGVNLRDVPHTHGLWEQKLYSADSTTKFWYACLCAGSQFADDNWEEYVETKLFYNEYREYAKCQSIRVEGDALFSKRLGELCSGMQRKKVYSSKVPRQPEQMFVKRSERVNALVFPDLNICRSQFEKACRFSIPWPEDE